MTKLTERAAVASLIALAAAIEPAASSAQAPQPTSAEVMLLSGQAAVEDIVQTWPARPRAVAYMMIREYGWPREAAHSKLVWHDNGPWKRTIVHREETPHDFPKPHTDVLEQVIDYRVSAETVDDLALFDGSLVVKRTEGEISARCDKEAMNFLTLNLANEVVLRTKTVAEARKVLAQHAMAFMTGGELSYTTGLHFVAFEEPTSDPDRTAIAGAPQRAPVGQSARSAAPANAPANIELVRGQEGPTDSTILAALIALNEYEVEQARLVLESTQDAAVRRFAERLKTHHGKGMRDAMEIAARTGITPRETDLVTSMKRDADSRMAELARPQNGDFDKAFVALAVKQQRQKLSRIERSFLPHVSNRDLALELVGVRARIASHLREARKLQQILEGRRVSEEPATP